MGGGWRNVSRMPTAFSNSTPSVGTALSSSSITKLERPAWGQTSGRSRLRSSSRAPKVISHCRIHSRMLSPHCHCVTKRRYWSARLMARSILRRSTSKSVTAESKAGVAIMSSASIKLLAMPTTRSKRLTLGVVRTKSGGSLWVFSPGTSTNLRSPTISMVTTYSPYRQLGRELSTYIDVPGIGRLQPGRLSRLRVQQVRTILQDLLALVKRVLKVLGAPALQFGFHVRNFMMYCDVSLPVPLDQAFTYRLPETMQRRVRPGCRVLVPFGPRKLTGMVLALRPDVPEGAGAGSVKE